MCGLRHARRCSCHCRAPVAYQVYTGWKWLVCKSNRVQVSMTNNPRQTQDGISCIWGTEGADKGKKLADTNTTNTGGPLLRRFLSQNLWSFGEISYWLGLGPLRNKFRIRWAPTPSAALWTGGSARKQTKMHAVLCTWWRGRAHTVHTVHTYIPSIAMFSILAAVFVTTLRQHSALIPFSCSPFDSEAGTWPVP